ncbi:hypothetical protein [Streptomyces hirsutus]|uniref:hypothetical protein n=1 Tax=Streptomyces hirsutus TaxID=35620 RepID=UPI003327B4A1
MIDRLRFTIGWPEPGRRGAGKDMVTVSYAEGWAAGARRAFGPLTRADAEERDGAGDPYVVLHRVPGHAVPAEVRLVAWRDRFVGQWVHGELERRTHEVDLRLLEDDRLFLRQYVERRYASPEQPDLAPDTWRPTVELLPCERAVTSRALDRTSRQSVNRSVPGRRPAWTAMASSKSTDETAPGLEGLSRLLLTARDGTTSFDPPGHEHAAQGRASRELHT